MPDKGRLGVHMHASGEYDAVLMDCQMPEMDDYVTKSLQAGCPRRGSCPVDFELEPLTIYPLPYRL